MIFETSFAIFKIFYEGFIKLKMTIILDGTI
jgi:hypothetical protein